MSNKINTKITIDVIKMFVEYVKNRDFENIKKITDKCWEMEFLDIYNNIGGLWCGSHVRRRKMSYQEWINLKKELIENGWSKEYPLSILVRNDGSVVLSDGNHRMLIACQLRSKVSSKVNKKSLIPVKFLYMHRDKWEDKGGFNDRFSCFPRMECGKCVSCRNTNKLFLPQLKK